MDILEINSQEFEVYQSYRILYEAQHPAPEMKNEYDWRDAGFIFKGKVVTTVAAVLLAGFRTAEQFFLAASNQGNVVLGWSEAILAVLAIEGLILFLAADNAKSRGRVHKWASTLGIFLAVSISLLAGLGQSIHLIQGLSAGLLSGFTTAVAIGLSFASIVAYIGGEIIGQELARIEIANDKNREEYKLEMESWENSLSSSWSRSQERKVIRSGIVKPNVSYTPVSPAFTDWREVPHKERLKIASMTPKQIKNEYKVERRTAYNWKDQAVEHAESYVYNQENE